MTGKTAPHDYPHLRLNEPVEAVSGHYTLTYEIRIRKNTV